MADLLRTEEPETVIPKSEYVTLRDGGLITIVHNGVAEDFRLLLKDPSWSWSATRLERNRISANFQGNPLWPYQVLKGWPDLCEYLGLRDQLSNQTAVIPTVANINQKLKWLFSAFDTREVFQFKVCGYLSEKEYVDLFIDQRQLPMACQLERDSIHDWSYHFVTLLFPEYLENLRITLKKIRCHMDQFEGTVSYDWNYYGHTQDEQGNMSGRSQTETLSHQEAVYRQMAVSLDVMTAKIVQLLKAEQVGMGHRCVAEKHAIAAFFQTPTLAALKQVLWLENNLPESLLREFAADTSNSVKVMDEINRQLDRLALKRKHFRTC